MAGFLGRIFSSFFAEHATEKLANSRLFTELARRTVDTQDALAAAAREMSANPEGARAAVREGAETFFSALRKEIAKDLGMAPAPAKAGLSAVAPPPPPSPPKTMR